MSDLESDAATICVRDQEIIIIIIIMSHRHLVAVKCDRMRQYCWRPFIK